MDKFEYLTHVIPLKGGILKRQSLDNSALIIELNKYGNLGWELISNIGTERGGWTTEVTLVFKRKKL